MERPERMPFNERAAARNWRPRTSGLPSEERALGLRHEMAPADCGGEAVGGEQPATALC